MPDPNVATNLGKKPKRPKRGGARYALPSGERRRYASGDGKAIGPAFPAPPARKSPRRSLAGGG